MGGEAGWAGRGGEERSAREKHTPTQLLPPFTHPPTHTHTQLAGVVSYGCVTVYQLAMVKSLTLNPASFTLILALLCIVFLVLLALMYVGVRQPRPTSATTHNY